MLSWAVNKIPCHLGKTGKSLKKKAYRLHGSRNSITHHWSNVNGQQLDAVANTCCWQLLNRIQYIGGG